jgi:acetyl-CoA carboxylase biotin carboxyl carrier protein
MPLHNLDPKTNGNSPSSPGTAAAEHSSVRDLGRELASLAGTLPGPLQRLSVRSGDCEIQVEWDTSPRRSDEGGEARSDGARSGGSRSDGVDIPDEEASGTVSVRSPLVGTYFSAPAPDAEPFVRPGDQIEAGQPLAIVEAMKMMNSVVAPEAGVVVDILVTNGQPVEFDQPLVVLFPQDGSS